MKGLLNAVTPLQAAIGVIQNQNPPGSGGAAVLELKQTPENWQGEGCEHYDDERDICLDEVEDTLVESSTSMFKPCPLCGGIMSPKSPNGKATYRGSIRCTACQHMMSGIRWRRGTGE